jgi:hypothetical protein
MQDILWTLRCHQTDGAVRAPLEPVTVVLGSSGKQRQQSTWCQLSSCACILSNSSKIISSAAGLTLRAQYPTMTSRQMWPVAKQAL